MEKDWNAGYEIWCSLRVDTNTNVVIGYNPESKFYVCWYYNIERDDYYWGVYDEDYEVVKQSFIKRAGLS